MKKFFVLRRNKNGDFEEEYNDKKIRAGWFRIESRENKAEKALIYTGKRIMFNRVVERAGTYYQAEDFVDNPSLDSLAHEMLVMQAAKVANESEQVSAEILNAVYTICKISPAELCQNMVDELYAAAIDQKYEETQSFAAKNLRTVWYYQHEKPIVGEIVGRIHVYIGQDPQSGRPIYQRLYSVKPEGVGYFNAILNNHDFLVHPLDATLIEDF